MDSIARDIWNGCTPLGRWTVAIPFIVVTYAMVATIFVGFLCMWPFMDPIEDAFVFLKRPFIVSKKRRSLTKWRYAAMLPALVGMITFIVLAIVSVGRGDHPPSVLTFSLLNFLYITGGIVLLVRLAEQVFKKLSQRRGLMSETATVTLTPEEEAEMTGANGAAFDLLRTQSAAKQEVPPCWLCMAPEVRQQARVDLVGYLQSQSPLAATLTTDNLDAFFSSLRLEDVVAKWRMAELRFKQRRAEGDPTAFFAR